MTLVIFHKQSLQIEILYSPRAHYFMEMKGVEECQTAKLF